jgi:hypothetical protein
MAVWSQGRVSWVTKVCRVIRRHTPNWPSFASRANRQPAFGPMVNHAANKRLHPTGLAATRLASA